MATNIRGFIIHRIYTLRKHINEDEPTKMTPEDFKSYINSLQIRKDELEGVLRECS